MISLALMTSTLTFSYEVSPLLDGPPERTALAALAVGISPSTLAACGVSAATASTMLAALPGDPSAVAELWSRTEALDAAVSATRSALEAVRAHPRDQGRQEALTTARSAEATARARLSEQQQLLRARAGASGLGEALGCLENAQPAHAAGLPAEWGVLELTPVRSAVLQRLLKAEARAIRMGRQVPEAVSTPLAQVRNDSRVVAARAASSEHRAGLDQLFVTLLDEQR